MKLVGNTWIPHDDGLFSSVFRQTDVYELPSLKRGLSFVKRHRTAVDGGAHVGSWTRYLADHFPDVLAFEPQPDNCACLRRNVEPWPNVDVWQCALGESAGEAGLDGGTNSGCWHLSNGSDVQIRPLDAFMLTDLDYLKLDVEGYEWAALKGGEETVKRCRPVVQIEEKKLPHHYEFPPARTLLESWGYREVGRWNKDVVFLCG